MNSAQDRIKMALGEAIFNSLVLAADLDQARAKLSAQDELIVQLTKKPGGEEGAEQPAEARPASEP